ncbi:MAG: NTP transferase domain-containing protein [Lachnospiraceae bacterium]
MIDLDEPVLPIGCVIMASGLGKRFGSDKLMASFQGNPMISQILQATSSALFAKPDCHTLESRPDFL